MKVKVFALIIILNVTSCLFGQTYDLCVRNKAVDGTAFTFDIYMKQTGPDDIYLGHSDFALVFENTQFSSPAVQVLTAETAIWDNYDLDVEILDDSVIVLSVGQPDFNNQTEFDQRIQQVSSNGDGTLIGRLSISTVSAGDDYRRLRWIWNEPLTHQTIVHTLNNTAEWESTDITLNAGIFYVPELNIRVFLQGAYDTGTGQMVTTLNPTYLPDKPPYADSLTMTVGSIPGDIVDYLYLELRQQPDGATIDGMSVFVDNLGYVNSIETGATTFEVDVAEGNYYIVLHHRNHLSVMSADPAELGIRTAKIDFTSDGSAYYGTGGGVDMTGTGVWGMIAGETNDTGIVTVADKASVVDELNNAGYYKADINFTGIVTVADKAHIVNNLNKASTVPVQ